MRVALDGTPLIAESGGVPRYVRELYGALGRLGGEDSYQLFTDQAVPGAVGPGPGALDRRWWFWGLPKALRRERIDVFHGTEFSVPYRRVCATVMSIHDLSPWLDRGWHGAGANRVRRRTPWLLRWGLATMVLTLTEAVRRQVISYFELPEDRVAAVPLAAGPAFRPVSGSRGEVPYFLYVGAIEPRKNLPLLLWAWREVRKRHPVRLKIAGVRRADGLLIAPEEGLDLLGPVPEEHLAALYSGAVAVVYPTFYEGFGLPVVEAMQCGAPVVTSRDPAVVEVAGGAAIHCGVPNAEEWVRALNSLIERPERQAEFRARGLARAAEYTWERTARETREVYRRAIEFEAVRA